MIAYYDDVRPQRPSSRRDLLEGESDLSVIAHSGNGFAIAPAGSQRDYRLPRGMSGGFPLTVPSWHAFRQAGLLAQRQTAEAQQVPPPLEAASLEVEHIRWPYVFYENGPSINVAYNLDDPKKRAVGFKLSEEMEIPAELASFKFTQREIEPGRNDPWFVFRNQRRILSHPASQSGGTWARIRPRPSRDIGVNPTIP